MSRKVWYQLVDEVTRGAFASTWPASVLSDGVHDIEDLTRKIQADYDHTQPRESNLLSAVAPSQLRVYENREAYVAANSEPLKPGSPVESLGGYTNLLIVEVPAACDSEAAQRKALLTTLEWREPTRLCEGSGKDWKYQGASDIVNSLKEPLVEHFNAWKVENQAPSMHAINLVLSGQGTGKSRMLDEVKGLLCEAASQAENQEFLERMQNAYVFNVSFENDTAPVGSLWHPDDPRYGVSYRMLYQLTKKKLNWAEFLNRVKDTYGKLFVTIKDVVAMLAELESVDVKDLTVILCVDSLQNLRKNSQSCDLYYALDALCRYLNSSEAFAVCVGSATVACHVEYEFGSSRQARNYLVPPTLCGEVILKPTTRLQRQLVDDMDGHGRALEVVYDAFRSGCAERWEQLNSTNVFWEIWELLEKKYGDLFQAIIFRDPEFCRSVLIAVLSRRTFGAVSAIGTETCYMSVDKLQSWGLFRFTSEGRLECAFIFLVLLIRSLPNCGEVDNINLTHSMLYWQTFGHFVAMFRQVKSVVYSGIPVSLDEFHTGARFGPIDDIQILEPTSRRIEDSDDYCNGVIRVEDMTTIGVKTSGTPAGDTFARVHLKIGENDIQCNEVIQCKLVEATNISQSMLEKTRGEAVGKSDVFLLITTGEVDTLTLPGRCGIVSKAEFDNYFGPFASRARRNLAEIPNINTSR
ncbi:hypothetical protein V7S43_004507 [Phytophthora oleae]|uniref:Crinkler (CRN) family protein n=1 Tax=Phytophthora oleae TaxID=2107226 RepID=A0ABD3FW55_9STRA